MPRKDVIDEKCLYIINKYTGCWIGNFALNSDGYCRPAIGEYYRSGSRMRRKRMPLHVYMYQKYYGSIPKDYELHHTCENRACCNIFHLKPILRKEHCKIHGIGWGTSRWQHLQIPYRRQ
jgi:hypothetical protein